MPPTAATLEREYQADAPDYVATLRREVEAAERAAGMTALAKGKSAIRLVKDGGWTRDLILTRLDRVYRAAFLDRKWPSAIRALELAGYEFGMFTKRVELDSFSEDHLRRIAEKAGLTLEQLRDAQSFLEAEVLND